MTTRRARHRGGWWLAGSLGLLLVGLVLLRQPLSPPPADPGAAPGPGPIAAKGPLATTTAERAEPPALDLVREQAVTSLGGVLLDNAGAPLAGWPITATSVARQSGPQPRLDLFDGPRLPQSDQCYHTDAAGRFEFTRLAAGDYDVVPWYANGVGQRVTVAPGASTFVELRFPAHLVAVIGRLTRDGEANDTDRVDIQRGEETVCSPRGVAGLRLAALAAGRYQVGARWHMAWISQCELSVEAGAAQQHWTLDASGNLVEVMVEGGPGCVGRSFGIDANGTPRFGDGDEYDTGGGTVGKLARMRLPPGRWRLHVHGPRLAGIVDQEVELEPGAPPLRVNFVAEPGVTVGLRLAGLRGPAVQLATELMPPLRAAGGCLVPFQQRDKKSQGYFGVPLGPATIVCEDRHEPGLVTFLPFEPESPLQFEVLDRDAQEVTLAVRPRPFVDLRACDATGREDFAACIEVWLGDRRVRGREERQGQRWAGWLPGGSYRVRIDRRGLVSERHLAVGDRDLTLRLRP